MSEIKTFKTKIQTNKLMVLVIGNIATGKTTFIESLNKRKRRTIILNDNYKGTNSSDMALDIYDGLINDKTVILEGNYLSRHIRSKVIYPISNYIENVFFICFDFGPGNNETLNRRLQNQRTSKKIVEVHNKNLKLYEKPILQEGFSRIVKCY